MLLLLGLIGGALMAIAAARRPAHALAALAVLLPTYVIRFSLPLPGLALPSTLLEMLVLGFVGGWTYANRRTAWARLATVVRAWRWPLALLLVASVIAVIAAPDHRAALGLWRAYIVEPMLVFAVAIEALRTKEDRDRVAGALAALAIAIGAIAIVQHFTGYGIPAPWTDEAGRRVTAMFGYPNAVGLLMAPLGVLAAGWGLAHLQDWRARKGLLALAAGATVAAVIAAVLAESEGALAGMAAGFFLLGIGTKKLRALTIAGAIAVIAIVLSVAPLRQYAVTLLTFQDWSGTVRRVMWKETVTMLGDHPLVGAGLSGYRAVIAPYHPDTKVEIFQYPHNVVLNFWSELGLLGVAAFTWVAVLTTRMMWGLRTSRHAPFALAVFAAVTAHGVHGLVDVPYFKNDLAILWWLLIALTWSLHFEESVANPSKTR
jgi:O-antigen ligase